MVVIVILGLLATLVVPHVLKQFQWAQRETAKVEIHQFERAVNQYALMNNGLRPETLEALTEPDANGVPQIEHSLRDPWKTPYAYAQDSEINRRPWIASYAADREPGGEGWDEDLENLTMDDD